MSSAATRFYSRNPRNLMKQLAKSLLQSHLPVGALSRPLFSILYRFHVGVRATLLFGTRFFWYEPLFRSQCQSVGRQFRMEQLPYLLGRGVIRIGERVELSGKSSIAFSARHCNQPSLLIGDGTFLGHNCALTIASQLEIGRHCLIAGGVRMADFDGHPIDADARRNGDFVAPDRVLPISIADDVWIGHGATILKGVTIGPRAIIGARAVVSRDVPADCIVVGNPAKIVRQLQKPCGELA